MSESDEQFTERLAKGWAEEVGKFDRTLLALATGALALSIPLVRDLTDPVNTRLVLWGWIFLLITPIFLLVSYAISKTAIEARWDGDDEKGNQRSRWAWNVTLTAGASFIFGAALIMLFVWLNIR